MSGRLPVLILTEDEKARFVHEVDRTLWDPVTLGDLGTTAEDLPQNLARLSARWAQGVVDPLTGLWPRARALAALEEAVKRPEAEALWLVLVNVDKFKVLNDSLGHTAADRVLAEAAARLRETLASAAFLGRLGGDTFLAALKGPHDLVRAEVEGYLEEIRRGGTGQSLTMSAGLVRHRPGEEAQALVERADHYLYEAKGRGRDQVVDDFDVQGEEGDDLDLELADFENRVRVFADRLVASLTARGRRMIETYRTEADHDGLTGLFNRRYFDRRLERETERSRRLESPLALVMVDLDDFGAVNRTYGFPAGDRALQAAATSLQRGVRVVDWTARYGGEELMAILPDTGLDAALAIAERIRSSLETLELEAVDGRKFGITGSLGVVVLEAGDEAPVHLIQRAGLAVRRSKLAGKNRVSVGPPPP